MPIEGRDSVLSVVRDDDRLRPPRDVPRALIYNTAQVHIQLSCVQTKFQWYIYKLYYNIVSITDYIASSQVLNCKSYTVIIRELGISYVDHTVLQWILNYYRPEWLKMTPLPSNRHHRRCGDCLEGKGENYLVCSVQYCVQQLCTVRCTHIWTD